MAKSCCPTVTSHTSTRFSIARTITECASVSWSLGKTSSCLVAARTRTYPQAISCEERSPRKTPTLTVVRWVEAFGSHPAVNAWVFGGDAGTNNTEANIEVWDIMADAIREEGSTLDIGIHLPPYEFDSLLYADVDFLDFAAPEIGHNKTPEQAQWEMEQAVEAYDCLLYTSPSPRDRG